MNLLERDIVEPLTGLLGAELERVIYHPLKGECTVDDLNGSNYIGGEISFYFRGFTRRCISWAENMGWRSHFSIKVSVESGLVPDAFETFDASNTNLWREAIGRKLTEIECLGWDQSPHILNLPSKHSHDSLVLPTRSVSAMGTIYISAMPPKCQTFLEPR